jgi:arylsulfatase A-like enzyme
MRRASFALVVVVVVLVLGLAAPAAAAPVFQLGDNRLLAHVQRGGGVVALPGSPGFAKYMRFAKGKPGWTIKQTVDGVRAGIADKYAYLDVPLSAEQAPAALSLTVRVKSAKPRPLSVILNGKSLGDIALDAGWQTKSIAVPPGQAKAGENALQLVTGGPKGDPLAFEWIQLGGVAGGDAAPPLFDPAKRELVIPRGGGLAWYVVAPSGGQLAGRVSSGCELTVRARTHDGGKADGKLGAAVDLGGVTGKIARLEITNDSCPEARLADAAITNAAPLKVVAKPKKPKYIVFWIMDSLRADRVKPFWSKARPDVPEFEKLCKVAACFTSTYVQGNESRASHAAIWSAQYAINHQMIKEGAKLDAKWTTIDEVAKAAGMFTSGESANGYIISRWGFGTKWDAYRNHIHDGGGVRGEDIFNLGMASVEKKVGSPWLLYLGTIDTHVSWRAKEPWISKYSPTYSGKYKKEASGKDVEQMATGKIKPSDADKQHIIAIYDSNVSYQDALVTKLFAKLQAWGIADDTMVIITADHGDEQWEDNRVGHGGSLKESLIRVPLAIHYPPLFPGGLVEEGVETIDIVPTIADALGQPMIADAQGESLVPLAQGVGRGYPRPSIASQYEFAHAMRLAGWKARVAGTGVPSVYHVAEDPYEKKDLAADRPLERRFLTDSLSTFLVYQKNWKKARWGVASNASRNFADDLEK